MPHIDGISLLHMFRAQASATEFVPVLVLTADVSRETLKQALAAGANDYSPSPSTSTRWCSGCATCSRSAFRTKA